MKESIGDIFREINEYGRFLFEYIRQRVDRWFSRFESRKDRIVGTLLRERGRYVRPFIHSGVIGLVFVGVTLGPTILTQSIGGSGDNGTGGPEPIPLVLGYVDDQSSAAIQTQISDKPRAEVVEYEVAAGDTVGQISQKFGVSEDTVYWENNLTPKSTLKPGQIVRVLPMTGVKHTVGRGETVHSIAEKFDVSAQAIVDWPYNTFTNDETFGLAVGQALMVPDGVKPKEVPVAPRQFLARQTPDAGTVTASGDWVWPAQGRISQQFVWYHPGVDIANKEGPTVVAADAGTVILVRSYAYGYGNHVMIDHGNGTQTLYGHLASFRVQEGQSVNRGDPIGVMGSTGRSTGTHLHFEIIQGGTKINPLSVLK